MKHILLAIFFGLGIANVEAQEFKASVINDTTELQEYDNGQKIKVNYRLDGRILTLKEKEKLVGKFPRLPQEFNIKNEGSDIIGEINFSLPPDSYKIKYPVQSFNSSSGTIDITRPIAGVPFPEFSWTDINGISYTLQQLKGKTVVLNFWHSSCIPCIAEMPLLNELVKQYEKKDVVFIASTPNTIAELKQFLGKKKFDYAQVAAIDPQQLFFPFPGWPVHIVIDGKGSIAFAAIGKQKDIEKTLKEKIDGSLKETSSQ